MDPIQKKNLFMKSMQHVTQKNTMFEEHGNPN